MKTTSFIKATVCVLLLFSSSAFAQGLDTLKLKFFIQGYYLGGGVMTTVLYNQLVDTDPYSGQVDTVTVELRIPAHTDSVAQTYTGILQYDGTLNCTFPDNVTDHAYYIVIRYKNALETWSSVPITMRDTITYDFSADSTMAYGDNMIDLYGEGIWSFYSGDVSDSTEVLGSKDGVIDLFDFNAIYPDIENGSGGYLASDIDGDGGVSVFDFIAIYDNITNGVAVMKPEDFACTFADTAFVDSSLLCHNRTTVTVMSYNATGTVFGKTTYAKVPAGTYIYTLTDAYGCAATDTLTIDPPASPCPDTLKLKFFIEGYYQGSGVMINALYYQGVDTNPYSGNVDTVTIELRSPAAVNTAAYSYTGLLKDDGIINCTFPDTVTERAYYIVIKHRNALETWSAEPVMLADTAVSYDFSTGQAQAYGNNMTDPYSEDTWAIYSGEVTDSTQARGAGDGVIDAYDFNLLYDDITNGAYGYYETDLNGDGVVDIFDFLMMLPHISNGVGVIRPNDIICGLDAQASIDIPINCYGDSATISFSVTGATGFLFGDTLRRGIPTGMHAFAFMDSYGCADTVWLEIDGPPELIADAGMDTAICRWAQATLGGSPTASGGVMPYTYAWAPAEDLNSDVVDNPVAQPDPGPGLLPIAHYLVVVTDSKGCIVTDTVAVTVNGTPAVEIVSSDVSCEGAANGSATVHAIGGITPYIYEWSPSGGTDATASELVVGTYTVTVADSLGCNSADSVDIEVFRHNSCSTAFSINPDSVYRDFSITDTVLWFGFVAQREELSLQFTRPFSLTDTANPGLESAILYKGTCGGYTQLASWDAMAPMQEININYSGLMPDSLYFIMLLRSEADCGFFSAIGAARLSDCDPTVCEPVGNGDFELFSGNKTDVAPFRARKVNCWSCSHGTPQIGVEVIDNVSNNYALMFYDKRQGSGEGIKSTLYEPISKNATDEMYVFHMRYKRESVEPDEEFDNVAIHVKLTTDNGASSFNCGSAGGGVPPDPTDDFEITDPPVSDAVEDEWKHYYKCINPTILVEDMTVLWIYPTSTDPDNSAWVNIDDVQLYKIDANLGALPDNEPTCICTATTIGPINCPPAAEIANDISYVWYCTPPDASIDGQTSSTISIDPLVITTYSLTITYDDGINEPCSITGSITIDPNCTANPVTILPDVEQICNKDNKAEFHTDPEGTGYQWTSDAGIIGSSTDPKVTLTGNASIDYTVTATFIDDFGCTATATKEFHWYPQDAMIVEVNPITCNGDGTYTAYVTVTVPSGHTPPFTYRLSSGGISGSANDFEFDVIINDAGTYTIFVDNDGQDCTGEAMFTVGFEVELQTTNVDCEDGGGSICVRNPLPGYSYQWYFNDTPIAGSTDACASGTIASGEYTVEVTYNNCMVRKNGFVNAQGFSAHITPIDATCEGSGNGTIEIEVPNGMGTYHYSWDGPGTADGSDDDDATYTITGLEPGSYTVTVTTAGELCSKTQTVTINDSIKVYIVATSEPKDNCTGWILTASGAISYEWYKDEVIIPGGTTESIIVGNGLQDYTVIGTGAGGCTATATVSITEIGEGCCSGPDASSSYIEIDYEEDDGFYYFTKPIYPVQPELTKFTLNNDVRVKSGTTVYFIGLELFIKEGKSITVEEGATLHIMGCAPAPPNDQNPNILKSCGPKMWKGIIVEGGGTLMVISCNTIKDAEFAIDARTNNSIGNKTKVNVIDCTFENNYVGIYVGPNSSGNDIDFTIRNCNFIRTGNSYLGRYDNKGVEADLGRIISSPDPDPLFPNSYAGIYVNNLRNVLNIPASNYFDHLNYGICAIKCSYVFIDNADFGGIADYSVNDIPKGTACIYGVGSGGGSEILTYQGRYPIGFPRFDRGINTHVSEIGIYAVGINLTVKKAWMTEMNLGVIYTGGLGKSISIEDSRFNATKVAGIILDGCDAAISKITNNEIVMSSQAAKNYESNGILSINTLWVLDKIIPSSDISGNKITLGNNAYSYGINLLSSRNFSVSNNDITLVDFSSVGEKLFGINFVNSPNVITSFNNIIGTDNTHDNSGAFAVRTKGCDNFTHECNCTNKTYEGFRFDGPGIGKLKTSNIYNHAFGLYVTSSANIGPQSHHANRWLGLYFNPDKHGAFWDIPLADPDRITKAKISAFKYSGSSHFTNNNFGMDEWFQEGSGIDTDCPFSDCN